MSTTRRGRRARWSAQPRARSREEQAFLALGPGAEAWLIKAAAAGATRVRRKMAEAVDLAKLHGAEQVEHALKVCAEAGRFGDGDLAAILAHQQSGTVIPFPARVSEESLAAALHPQLGGVRAMSGYRCEADAFAGPAREGLLYGARQLLVRVRLSTGRASRHGSRPACRTPIPICGPRRRALALSCCRPPRTLTANARANWWQEAAR